MLILGPKMTYLPHFEHNINFPSKSKLASLNQFLPSSTISEKPNEKILKKGQKQELGDNLSICMLLKALLILLAQAPQ